MKSMRGCKARLKAVKQWLKRMPLVVIPAVFVLRILRGWHTYRRILRACPPKEGWRVWFMDYEGSGDTYLTCGYLQSLGMLGQKDAFAGSEGPSMKVAKLFGFGRYAAVKPKAALTVRLMERFYGEKLAFLPLLYESEYLEYSGLLRFAAGCRGMDFMTMLKVGLEANCGVPYREGPWAQPVFPYDEEEIDAIFKERGLIPSRTVLLAPYAGKSDMCGVPMAFYAELAGKLRAAGYTVCTNTGGGAKEPPVPGTKPLLVPYRLIRPFCERAGVFIGIRSGLCDIVSGAKCNKVMIYGDVLFSSAAVTYKEYFSLRNMGLCDDTMEEEITEENLGDLSKTIAEIIIKDKGEKLYGAIHTEN